VAVNVPPGVMITTSTTPAAWAGEVKVSVVSVFAVTVASMPPIVTLAFARPVPVAVTLVPPVAGPDVGPPPVTEGGLR
jgi:hypothetical protein